MPTVSRPTRARRPSVAGGALLGALAVGALAVSAWGLAPGATDAPASEGARDTSFTVLGAPPTRRPELNNPRDPLSAAEVGYAIHLARSDWTVPDSATDVRGDPGPEVLLVELPSQIDAERRLATVHLYDYTADRGYQQTVDLRTGAVNSRSARGSGAKISPDEARTAVQLAIAHEPDLPFLAEFHAAQGVPLVSADQLGFTAGTFTFDGSTAGGAPCRAHRCAQLMLQLPSGTYLSTGEFVVDLSARSVVQLE